MNRHSIILKCKMEKCNVRCKMDVRLQIQWIYITKLKMEQWHLYRIC